MFNWNTDAEKAAKLITGSKKVVLLAMYAGVICKIAPHIWHWITVKAETVAALVHTL